MAGCTTDILRRKAGAAGRAPPGPGTLTPEKAMRLAFGRAAREVPGLGLRLTGFTMERVALADLPGKAPDGALTALLAKGEAPAGAMFLDGGFIAAVIEAETTGRVVPGDLPERAPTRIDALIAGGFADRALAAFDALAGELSIGPSVTGFRSGDVLASAAVLGLVLEDVAYRVIGMEFDFCDGARQGAAVLAMPLETAGVRDAQERRAQGESLTRPVMAAEARLRAVLTRLTLPLDAVARWEPGALVPLRREVLDEVVLEDIEGAVVAGGRLGQAGGQRAVRLRSEG